MLSYLFQDCELYESEENDHRRFNFEYTTLINENSLKVAINRHLHNVTYFKGIYSEEDLSI